MSVAESVGKMYARSTGFGEDTLDRGSAQALRFLDHLVQKRGWAGIDKRSGSRPHDHDAAQPGLEACTDRRRRRHDASRCAARDSAAVRAAGLGVSAPSDSLALAGPIGSRFRETGSGASSSSDGGVQAALFLAVRRLFLP